MSEAPVVRFEVEDGIGVITVDYPPVNALGPGVRPSTPAIPKSEIRRQSATTRHSIDATASSPRVP